MAVIPIRESYQQNRITLKCYELGALGARVLGSRDWSLNPPAKINFSMLWVIAFHPKEAID
jgi:hypothetical protein